MKNPEGKWTLDVVLTPADAPVAVTIRATRRTKQELNLAWREAKRMASAGQLSSARAYNADSGVVLGETS